MVDNFRHDLLSPILNPILKNDALLGPALLVARVFMATVFLTFGIGKIIHNTRMQEYMEAHGVTSSLLPLAIVVQLVCGTLIVLGYQTRFAALMLSGFCIIATSLFHTQFNVTGELSHFTKDFAIAGGFLFMIAYGPGPLSLDARIARAKASREGQPAGRTHEQVLRT